MASQFILKHMVSPYTRWAGGQVVDCPFALVTLLTGGAGDFRDAVKMCVQYWCVSSAKMARVTRSNVAPVVRLLLFGSLGWHGAINSSRC
jgi:hypothetical protein